MRREWDQPSFWAERRQIISRTELERDLPRRGIAALAGFQALTAVIGIARLFAGGSAGWFVAVVAAVATALVLMLWSKRLPRPPASSLSLGEEWTWTIDREGHFIGSNAVVRQILGYTAEEIVGRDSLPLLLAPDEDLSDLDLAKLAAHRQGWMNRQMALLDRDGRVRVVRTSAAPLLDVDGDLIGWQGSTRDLMKDLPLEATARAREPIERIMANEDVRIDFQPVVDLRLNEIVGAEALSRFLVEPYRTPDRWFRAAHLAGLGVELELFTLRRALANLDRLPQGVYLALNVSPETLTHASLFGYLCACDGTRIVLELTEHASVSHDRYPFVRSATKRLSELGIRLAIDDAGAGFSSFHHVLELGPELIKLDRSMVRNIDVDPSRQALAASLANFASEIGAVVVAEGIETEDQLRAVRAAGVQFGQGFGLARPGPLPLPSLNGSMATKADIRRV